MDKQPPVTDIGTVRRLKPSGPIAEYLGQSLKKKLPGIELEDGMTDELAEFALERELRLGEALIREAANLVLKPCWACGGDEAERSKCESCERTGYFYPPEIRLKAMSRTRDVSDHRIKLLSLDNKTQRPPPVDPELAEFFESLNNLSQDELDAQFRKLQAGQTD